MKECPACRRCFPDEINHCPQDGDATIPSLLGEPILDARYQLERRLGQGGMGVVFQARHIFLKTSHAIKVILPDLVGNDPMLVTRFRQEALAAAAIRHQNIIAVTDFGVVRGTMPFLVMEFVNGKSLQDILADEKVMPPARALEFICAMGAGVAAAHRQNIVHRDLKPLNVMAQTGAPVSEGVKILDFGLAKIKSGELLGSFIQAKTSGLMGSPFYMAPEQWSDEEPDARADIYSLGIILYQMLSGDVPFKGSSIPSIMKKHLTLPVPTFKSVGVDVAPRIESVVHTALEKEASARMPSVEVFLNELREAVASTGATIGAGRETVSIDANQTLVTPLTSAGASTGETRAQTTSREETTESLAGTISSAALSASERERLSASRADYERELEERNRIAREELEREAEQQRKAAERKRQEAELKRREEERRRQEDENRQQEAERLRQDEERKKQQEQERLRREREEREERERQHRQQIERVERQAKELEDRLARLSTSIPPAVGVKEPEENRMRGGLKTQVMGNNSFPGAAVLPGTTSPSLPPSRSQLEVSIPGKSKSSSLLILGGVVLLLLLVAGVIGVYFLLRSRPAPAVDVPVAHDTNQGTNDTATEATKPDLVEIPGGSFQMGRNDGPPQEQPEHPATVEKFFIDRTEVTNAEYAEFVRDSNHQPPSHWTNGKPSPGQEKWPVVNVSPQDAEAFAAWRSKRDGVIYRLPTEEEWEFAARNGGEYQLYPWGDTWEERHAAVKEASPRAVGSYPDGKNRWGVLDLIGNAWEWTSSKASVYGGPTEIPPENREWVVARGGSYASDPNDERIPVSATYRDWFAPTLTHPNFGFRLVRPSQ